MLEFFDFEYPAQMYFNPDVYNYAISWDTSFEKTKRFYAACAAVMEMFAMMDAERAAEFLANNKRCDGNTLKPILGSDLQSSHVLAVFRLGHFKPAAIDYFCFASDDLTMTWHKIRAQWFGINTVGL